MNDADHFRLGTQPNDDDVCKANWIIDRQTARIEEWEKACFEWAEVSQNNYQRAKAAEAALGQLLDQVYQMQGMFGDEDGAIARAVSDAESALEVASGMPSQKSDTDEAEAIMARTEKLAAQATMHAMYFGGDNATAAADLMMAFVLLSVRDGAKPERTIEAMGNHAIAACGHFWGADGRRRDE